MPIQEIKVVPIKPEFDVRGKAAENIVRQSAETSLLEGIRSARVWWVEGITEEEAKNFAQKVLANPLTEEFTVNSPDAENKPGVVRVAYHQGMTDPQRQSVMKIAQYHGLTGLSEVASGVEYMFEGNMSESDVEALTKRLFNKNIEEVVTERPETLIIHGEVETSGEIQIRDCTLEELREISSKSKTYLEDDQMLAIQAEFRRLGRDIKVAELQYLGGAWSDHCAHTTTNAETISEGRREKSLFKMIKETAQKHFKDLVLSAFEDNSGVFKFYEDEAINVKGETHISPSAEEPVNGAATGVGGLLRDINETGKGAKPVLTIDIFCVAPLDLHASQLPPGCLDPGTILRGIVKGVRDYGNPMGVPTAGGSVHFHPEFKAKPTVLVIGYGIMKEQDAQKDKLLPGDKVVVFGGRTGKDGIHGATFSGVEKHAKTGEIHSSAVQIANPIEEKRMFDAVLECTNKGWFKLLTDLGAAGLASGVGELGKELGAKIDLSRAPLKYRKLIDWEIHQSESQERGVGAVVPEHITDVLDTFRRHNVEATVLGEFTGDKRYVVNFGDKNLVDLSYEFIEKGLPIKVMETEWAKPLRFEGEVREPQDEEEWVKTVEAVLAHGDVCSKEWIHRQYDYGVQGTTVLAPFTGVHRDCPNDAIVKAPIFGKPYGLVASHAEDPGLSEIDPEQASILIATQAVAKAVAVGANPDETVWINNYISGKVRESQMMGALKRCVGGVCKAMDFYETAVISGKDSVSSTFVYPDGRKEHVQPYVAISTAGRIPDIENTVSADIKEIGSILCLVGQVDTENLGGSVYYKTKGQVGNELPQIDPKVARKVAKTMYQAIQTGAVKSCKSLGEGGLFSIISQMGFGGDCGLDIEIPEDKVRADNFLFNQTPGAFVVEVKDEEEVRRLFSDVPCIVLGKTTAEKNMKVVKDGRELFNVSMNYLKEAWKGTLKGMFA